MADIAHKKLEGSEGWTLLGEVDPARVLDAANQAHYAIHFVSSFAEKYIYSKKDYSHMGLKWNNAGKEVVSGVAFGARKVRMALNLSKFEFYILGPDQGTLGVLDRFNLNGKTLGQASQWFMKTVTRFGFDPELVSLDFDSMPEHKLKSGHIFTYDGGEPELEEISAYLSNTHLLLHEICSKIELCSPIHIWSNRFEIGSVIVEQDGSGNDRTIGLGFVPLDVEIKEPYFFVSVYPAPEGPLPASPKGSGIWNSEGWTGFRLDAANVVKTGDSPSQFGQVKEFMLSSIKALRENNAGK